MKLIKIINNKVNKFTNIYIKPFIFAIAITFGFYIAVQELYLYKNQYRFLIFSIIVLVIYISEIVNLYAYKSKKIQLNLKLNDNVNELLEFLHKILLPIVLYITFILFSRFHYNSYFLNINLFVVFFVFFILLINTHSFFQAKLSSESKTHYIYDVTKFFVFFLFTDYFVNLGQENYQNVLIYSIIFFVFSVLIKLALMFRSELFKIVYINISIFSSVLLSVFYILFTYSSNFSKLEISLFLLVLFYISIALLHHLALKNLKPKIVFEYLIFVLLFLVIISSIN